MNIIIAFLPAIGWGVMPWIVNKVPNSKPANQILGVGMGATIVGIIVTLSQHPTMSMPVFFLSLLSGALWTIGQIGQFISFTRIGVSKTMPISTGLQLVGNTIIGALIFGEWKTSNDFIFGIIALIIIMVGVILTAYTEKGDDFTQKTTNKDILFLVLTTVYLAFSGNKAAFKEKASYLDLFAGISFGIAAYTYIISAQVNGVTNAFIYGQLSVIISTIGGMTLLGERKQGKELVATLAGLCLIVVGAIL